MNHFEKYESYIPFDLLVPGNFLVAFLCLTFIVIFRYFLLTLLFYVPFYKRTSHWTQKRQIYSKLPDHKAQLFEIKWSLVTSVIFGVSGILLGVFWQLGWARFYLRFDQYGWTYLFLSPLILSLLHDLYFYLTHRMLHIPWMYRRFHSVHHASLKPSPWASFSFHPVESIIEALPIPLFSLILPLHPVVIVIYLTAMTLSAIINHLGFEVMPLKLQKWFISGTHHSNHHRHFNSNYGLFYTFWDRLLGTEYDPKKSPRPKFR